MMHYINIEKKRLCGRNNQTIPPLIVDYSTVENVEFTFINSNNQIQPLEAGLSGLYFAGSLKMGDMSSNLLFLSKDYTISGNVLTFKVDTYTQSYLQQIKKKNTEINIEIGQISLDTKQLLLRDYALANPRVYVAGLSPAEIESNDYYTKEESNELVAQSLDAAEEFASALALELSSSIDGKVDTTTFTEAVDNIENEISAISGSIAGFATEADLQLVSGAVDENAGAIVDLAGDIQIISGDVDTLKTDITGKADKSDVDIISGKVDGHIADTTIHVTAADKTAWNGKLDPSALNGYATEQYVNGQVSGKADQSALTAHTSDTEIHTTALEKAAWDAKQNAITNDNKLDYALLSGTPAIPTAVSQLTNDSGYQTASDVETAISGKQDKITAEAKLDYALLSGTPDLSIYATDADLQLVSGELSSKQDKITSNNKLDYALLSGVPEDNPALVPIEVKTATGDCEYVVDFTGKAIQKYDATSATAGSNSLEILFTNLSNVPSGFAPTIELQIPVTEADVSTITLPAGTQIIDMPDSLTYTSGKISYADIVFRAEKDVNDTIKVYCNYSYNFDEEEEV